MKVAPDPRFIRRRTAVREEGARRGLRRAFKLVLGVVAVAFLVWLAQSPPFSVRHLDIRGAGRTDVTGALQRSGLVEGRPMIRVRSGEVEEVLRADPWVVQATVDKAFPDRVTVVIEERHEAVSVGAGDRWMVVADDGRVMSIESSPRPGLGVAEMETSPLRPGDFVQDPLAVGAIEFVATLAGRHAVRVEFREGELWADVDGYAVRLGDGRDPAVKARAVEALLADGPPEAGSILVVVAPQRPAVVPPNLQHEG